MIIFCVVNRKKDLEAYHVWILNRFLIILNNPHNNFILYISDFCLTYINFDVIL